MLQGGIDLLFYGDSLTELWRGTAWGYNSRLGGGIPAVFSRYFGQYRSVVCGSGGARIILFHMFSSSKYGPAWVQHASEVITKLSRHAASAILAYRPGTYLANWMVKSLCVCAVLTVWMCWQATQLQIYGGAFKMGSYRATTSRSWLWS
jgi:hypothetical protein